MCGIANILMLLNIAFLIVTGAPIFFMLPLVLFVSNMVIFYYSQHIRHNRPLDVFYEQVMNFVLVPVYLEAFVVAMLGTKVPFAVTYKSPEGADMKAPDLKAQYAILALSMAALAAGILNIGWNDPGLTLMNIFWLVYPILMLGAGIALTKRFQPAPKPAPARSFLQVFQSFLINLGQ
jgi:hypothetical protein